MVNETVTNSPSQDIRKERFEFVLKINDYIVCQRYFKMARVRTSALYSEELLDTLNYCVELIQNDLRNKSNLYNCYTAPQVFNNQDEFETWITQNRLDTPAFVLFRDSESVNIWDGEKLKPFEKRFNISDYIGNKPSEEESSNTLKFEFLDNGHVLYAKIWDANVYPRFIRNNIDLSNSKNKYNFDESPFEAFLIKLLTKDRTDLIYKIINTICETCTDENMKYTTNLKYGKTTYRTMENKTITNE